MRLAFRPEVPADLQDAYDWYEDRRAGLGESLLEEVDRLLRRIEEWPSMHPTVYRAVRRATLQRFPCSVFFLPEEGRIVGLTIHHQARHPGRWQDRL